MIDEQQLFDRFHAAFDVEPRAGMRDRIRTKLVSAGSGSARPTDLHWTAWSISIGRATKHRSEILGLVAALLALLLAGGLLVAMNAIQHPQTVPVRNEPRTGGTAVLPVDERWYWSANDAAVLVDPNAGDKFAFPTVEITHDGGRSWTSTTFQNSIGIVPVLRWFDSRHIALYSEMGSMYSTSDGGDHWTFSSMGLALLPESAYFLSADEGWALCSTTAACNSGTNPSSDYTLYRTLDAGAHWESLGRGFAIGCDTHVNPPSCRVGPGGLVFADADHGFIGTYSTDGLGSLFVTADGGRTWRLVRIPVAVASQTAGNIDTSLPVMFGNGGVVVVTTGSGVFTYTTTDYGFTWSNPQRLPGRFTPFGRCCIPQSLATDGWNDWWAVDGAGVLFRSQDQGQTWKRVPAVLSRGMVLDSIHAVGGNVLWGGAQTGSDPHTFPVRSTDGGTTWSVVELAPAQPRVLAPPDSPPFANLGCRFGC